MGGIVGGLSGPYWYGIQTTLVQTVLHARFSGFPILIIDFVVVLGHVFGAVTGCALVYSFGKYRSFAGGGLVLFGLTAAAFMVCDLKSGHFWKKGAGQGE